MRSRFSFAATAFAMLVTAVSLGCADEPTALFVVMETDIAQATSIDIEASGPMMSESRDVLLADAERPLQLTLEPGEGTPLDASVELRVEVRDASGAILSRRVTTSFVPHRVTMLVLRLSSSCVGASCPEECDDGACVPRAEVGTPWTGGVPDASIQRVDGGTDEDGGVDASVDGGTGATCVPPHDAGPSSTCDRDAGVRACPAPFVCRMDQEEQNVCLLQIGPERASAGPDHTCVVGSRSQVVCWGDEAGGRLGAMRADDGVTETNDALVVVPGIVDATRVAAGDVFGCAVHRNGRIACWGEGADAWLGACSGAPVETVLPEGRTAREIAAGDGYACAIANDGTAWCWGESDDQRLGSDVEDTAAPVRVGTLSDLEGLTVGARHACAWTRAGAGFCWGANDRGQLGDASTEVRTSPVAIGGALPIAQITAGEAHTCALTRSPARVLCWGANDRGQLGRTGADSLAPVEVTAVAGATEVVAGWDHTCVIRNESDGGVAPVAFCWGDDREMQTGGSMGNPSVAANMYNRPAALALGRSHSCFLDEGGAQCFGSNDLLQLGELAGASNRSPQRVGGLQ